MVDSIPRGRVASYGQVAREAGLPRHARHVGFALGKLPPGSELPWHRVLGADGRLREGAKRGKREQQRRLRAEGVRVSVEGRVDMKTFAWTPTD